MLGDDGTNLEVDRFFASRRATALMKHALLTYLVPFAAKAGSRSVDGRVCFIDGYAGPGRYIDQTPGSPAIIAALAGNPALRARQIEGHFVEQNVDHFRQLEAMVTEERQKDLLHVYHGNIADRLTDLLAATAGAPTFIFLDPYGFGLDFETMVNIFTNRPNAVGSPATELLLRFDAGTVWRMRGQLCNPNFPGKEKSQAKMDAAVGGSWWRDENNWELENKQYLEWFENRFLSEFTKRTGCGGWSVQVKHQEHHLPAYFMFFFSRHRAGLWTFGQTISKALETWRKAIFDEAWNAKQDELILFPLDTQSILERTESDLADSWVDIIEANLRRLLKAESRITVGDKLQEIHGETLGIAREMHLRKALKRLKADGTTSSDQRGDLEKKIITRQEPA